MSEPKPKANIYANFSNRACALVVDFLVVSYCATLLADTGLSRPVLCTVLAVLYSWGMPLTRLQGTFGKLIFRIKICDRAGKRVNWRDSAIRAVLLVSWIGLGIFFTEIRSDSEIYRAIRIIILSLLFLPFVTAGFMPRRESVMDLLAGTLVVRYGADTEGIIAAEPAPRAGFLRVGGTIISGVLLGLVFMVFGDVAHDKGLRARVSYALAQTVPLREKIEVFHVREKGWPNATALGIPDWTPYPDGGGYRLGTNGSIQISFTVLPGLKGHSLTLHPISSGEREKIQWKCTADAEFPVRFLPAICR